MNQPWKPERLVEEEEARELIAAQFPDLVPKRLEVLGVGWDNIAYLVDGEYVFRFPRRTMGAELMESECRVLPALAARLPLPIPEPRWISKPTESYPWTFAGYRRLAGRTACRAALDDEERARLAAPLGEFLRALHSIPLAEIEALEPTGDTLRRVDLEFRLPQVEERLDTLHRSGLLDDPTPWRAVLDDLPLDWKPGARALVHGDLYARHLLVDDDAKLCGVIDWGDVHLGDPAVDFSIAHGFLPAAARGAFRDAYGPLDEKAWRVGRFRGLLSALWILDYGHQAGDEAMAREGRIALTHLRE